MIRAIVKEPDPILRRKATAVQEFTPEIQRLIDDMIETMHVAEGVGLAANQIGSPLNILVASADGKRGQELVLVNATLTHRRGTHSSAEGCLSVPGVSAEVERFSEITVAGKDRNGRPLTLRAIGLMAKILQHEVDHLQGHLYLDRLKPSQKESLLKKYRKIHDTLRKVDL